MAHRNITGTFDALNEESAIVYARHISVDLAFDGTASVQVRVRSNGTNWRVVATKTATESFELGPRATPVEWSLRCSAYTDDFTPSTWSILPREPHTGSAVLWQETVSERP